MALLERADLHTRHVLKINVIRYRLNKGKLELSLALPCLHCRNLLAKTAEYRYNHFGQVIKLRYSLNNQTLSPYMTINELPVSSLSSGFRSLYKKYL